MVNIFDVARYILYVIGGQMCPGKLQKLCYYCQAWHLAWYGKPLFPESFKRWKNGPMCRELFNAKPTYCSICKNDIKKKYLSGETLSLEEMRTIYQIIEDYGMYNSAQLSEIAYHEDPWKLTKRDEVIPNEIMKKYYKRLIEGDGAD